MLEMKLPRGRFWCSWFAQKLHHTELGTNSKSEVLSRGINVSEVSHLLVIHLPRNDFN